MAIIEVYCEPLDFHHEMVIQWLVGLVHCYHKLHKHNLIQAHEKYRPRVASGCLKYKILLSQTNVETQRFVVS